MKNKSFLLRLSTLLLALVLLLSVCSCTSSDEENGEKTPNQNPGESTQSSEESTLETDPLETLPNVTYGYEKFTFLLRDGAEHISDIGVEKLTSTSSIVDEAVYERNMEIQERFQVDFKFVKVAVKEQAATINNAVKGDPELYDVIAADGRTVFTGVTSGYYADWNELEYIDLDAEWWSQSARKEWTTPSGKLFAMNGDLSYMSIGNNCAVFFNKDIVEKVGVTSPYQQVFENNWTLDTFMSTVKQVDSNMNHDNTDKIESDSFGYATQQWRGPIYVSFCANVPSLVKDADGRYQIGWKDELVGNTVEKYIDLINESGAAYYGTDLNKVRNAFKNERVAFTDDNVKCAVYFSDLEWDFGIVPYPKATAENEFSSLVGSGTNTFAVVKNMSEAKRTRSSAILEAMACYGYVDVIPCYYDTVLSYQKMRDEQSLEMLKIIRSAGFYDLGHYINYGNVADLTKLMIEKPSTYGTSIYTAITKVESEVLAMLEVFYTLE